ncbi:gamma-glutamyl-gamma-aminobutyrate hydrolase family protein [Ureibacillus acetophenoni]|uniref:Putative glutamine amidotransferase n=1 Tax=Ureibacillus acetophenoni TaxID=614649 RepID=A0A285UCE3_9BACL|nr:gamma-glutamyl-gamma-aminobutyrate hydrolase family protein [Ureibacillus acetophenoni]SOC38246.1 putative glutamine amidotransferase [Ureibacillus acetophenoni]
MKPVIGLTLSVENDTSFINWRYTKSIIEAGGLPVGIPLWVEEDAEQLVQMFDGLVLSGGGDIHPHIFGEEPHQKLGPVNSDRDRMELALAKAAIKQGIPIFAICRGHQVLNVALGGTIYQDIYSQRKDIYLHSQTAPRHEGTHFISVSENSLLYKLLGKDKIVVNSFHHQAIKDVAPGVKVTGKANDGIIEAVEIKDYPFCLSVQWHPEEMGMGGDEDSKKLFAAFIEASKKVEVGSK